ncbi:GNAT family N-acetyltransferase [Sulfuracidifex tepidarius]|uniref:N-acetyltransferase domain-containing protein n=1 Tax=Sulfuracidifex tepidarius TaxID=1294262 RepID=A0A510DY37_9CREN|nr:GNAT family protein [Sulfuracidifex tepidarius]BBG25146.1 hypothetical protein IC006_2481 [Sulfuracidifex tepidarius]BBG27934.1 hypothetical protein IC007_2489 [Sulfuracidifex tepidarius]
MMKEFKLNGREVVLEIGKEDHFQQFLSFINEIKDDPENFNLFRYREPESLRLKSWVSSWKGNVMLAFHDEKVVGFSQMAEPVFGNLQNHVKEFAISLSKEFRGSGLAQLMFLNHLNLYPDVKKITAWVDVRNVRSIRMLTNAGMQKKCVLEDFIYSQRERTYCSVTFLMGDVNVIRDNLLTKLKSKNI